MIAKEILKLCRLIANFFFSFLVLISQFTSKRAPKTNVDGVAWCLIWFIRLVSCTDVNKFCPKATLLIERFNRFSLFFS